MWIDKKKKYHIWRTGGCNGVRSPWQPREDNGREETTSARHKSWSNGSLSAAFANDAKPVSPRNTRTGNTTRRNTGGKRETDASSQCCHGRRPETSVRTTTTERFQGFRTSDDRFYSFRKLLFSSDICVTIGTIIQRDGLPICTHTACVVPN